LERALENFTVGCIGRTHLELVLAFRFAATIALQNAGKCADKGAPTIIFGCNV